MSADVGPRKWALEKAALDEAYQEKIRVLFGAFYFASVSTSEKNALEVFKANLETLRRAHTKAISIFSDHDQM